MSLIKNKLAQTPEFAEFAKKMRNRGESFRSIADALLKRGCQISHMAVKNYFDKTDALGQDLIARDQALREEIKKDVIDTQSQMKKINEKLWSIMEELETAEKKDYRLILQALDKLLKQSDINSKTLQRITPTSVTQNVSYLDFSIRVNTYIEKLEKAGLIKILKPLDIEPINIKDIKE